MKRPYANADTYANADGNTGTNKYTDTETDSINQHGTVHYGLHLICQHLQVGLGHGDGHAQQEADGKKYTPESYRDALGFDVKDYVNLSSFTHHPFYEQFIIEVPDNWRWDTAYNLPVNELMEVMENAIMKGYTIAWGSDVSEKGFTRNGTAVIVEEQKAKGSDMEHWTGKSEAKQDEAKKVDDFVVTDEMRLEGYNNKTTTDDHGMHIYGLAKDQNGELYYMVKNSWGESGKYKGIWYASEDFVSYKTLNIVVHKDALPKHIAKKLGIK